MKLTVVGVSSIMIFQMSTMSRLLVGFIYKNCKASLLLDFIYEIANSSLPQNMFSYLNIPYSIMPIQPNQASLFLPLL